MSVILPRVTENDTFKKFVEKINDTMGAVESTDQNMESEVSRIDADKATKAEVEVERQRINNLTSLPEGSTTGDAELMDIRVGADGKTYPTAGEAVRKQLNKLKGNLDKLESNITETKQVIEVKTPIETYEKTAYNSEGVSRTGNYNNCAKYDISSFDEIIVSGSGSANQSGEVYPFPLLVFFSSSNVVVGYEVGTESTSALAISDYTCEVPPNASYVIINNVTSYNTISLSVTSVSNSIKYEALPIDKLSSATEYNDYKILDNEVIQYKQVYRSGKIVSAISTCGRYALYDVSKYQGKRLLVSGYGGDNAYRPLIVYYNSSELSSSTKVGIDNGTTSTLDVIIEDYEVTIPSNALYMAVNGNWNKNPKVITKDKVDMTMVAKENLSYSLKGELLINKLSNSTILCNGDSIMLAYNGEKGWWGLLQQKYPNAIVKNYGEGGTGFVVDNSISTINARLQIMHEDFPNADYIILQGGVNDCYGKVPLGSISSDYQTFDTTTFAGAFESCLKDAVTLFPNAIIVFVLTYKIPNAQNFDAYMEILKNACKKWSIPTCNLYDESGIPLALPYFTTNFTNNGDGTHFTLNGYKRTFSKLENVLLTN